MPVADADLREALAGVLGEPVRALSRRPGAYGSSYAIEDLEVTLSGGGAPLRLVFKDVAAASLAPAAAGAKPAELIDSAREIAAYRDVLRPAGVDAPGCIGSVSEPGAGRYWLFLEAVDGVPLWQVEDPSVWDEAARWLARLHGSAAPRASCSPHLLSYDAAYFRRWIARATEYTPGDALARVAGSWERVVERLCGWPRAFVHGEFYPSNVLVQDGARVRPLDWEMAGTGPGLIDVAALVAGGWSAAERERMALAYLEALPAGAPRPSRDELLDALAHARLYVAVKWLGWSPEWSPPAEHAHDWLADALAIAEELSL